MLLFIGMRYFNIVPDVMCNSEKKSFQQSKYILVLVPFHPANAIIRDKNKAKSFNVLFSVIIFQQVHSFFTLGYNYNSFSFNKERKKIYGDCTEKRV